MENNGNSNPRCGGLYSMATVHKASFYCKPRKTGRYVNIRLEETGMILTLCEVEVYSESRGEVYPKLISFFFLAQRERERERNVRKREIAMRCDSE